MVFEEKDPRYYNKPKMFMPQVNWISDGDGNIVVDYVLRFENLREDFDVLCEKLGSSADLPHIKSTKRDDYHDYYDGDTQSTVARWFEKDIQEFGYQF